MIWGHDPFIIWLHKILIKTKMFIVFNFVLKWISPKSINELRGDHMACKPKGGDKKPKSKKWSYKEGVLWPP